MPLGLGRENSGGGSLKSNAVDISVMLEEIEAEGELCICKPDSALEFEDSDTDIASEYSTDLVKVRQGKCQEYNSENGYKITDHHDV